MASMITKLYTTHVVVNACGCVCAGVIKIMLCKPVVFAEIRPRKPKKIKSNLCMFSVQH